MNKENKKNLVKLAKYILEEVSDEQFDMKWFRSNHIDTGVEFFSKENCGTVGCALGWAPFVKGLEVIEDDYDYLDYLNFHIYSNRVFRGVLGRYWDFLFDGAWFESDGSREGFVKRVIYLLEGGKDLDHTTNQYEEIDPNKIYDYYLFD